jgi:sigma-E factor negative regulatory protein RseA
MKDRISALMDGELDERSAEETLKALGGGEGLETWRTYHLIGDALRETAPLSAAFSERMLARIGGEPTIVAPGRIAREPRRWVALSAAASLAAVALVGWLAFAPQQAPAPLAQAPAARSLGEVKPVKPALVPLPSGTNDYLLAHQGFSPRVSIQGMAPYVRTVSEQVNETRK